MAEARDQSEFNYAVSFLNRLNMWFYIANEAAMTLNPFNWFHALLAIRRELSDDMTKEEIKKSGEYKTKINEMLPRVIRQKEFTGNNEIPGELYEELDHFEIFLRNVVKKAGYKTKLREDPRFALTGMG